MGRQEARDRDRESVSKRQSVASSYSDSYGIKDCMCVHGNTMCCVILSISFGVALVHSFYIVLDDVEPYTNVL